MNRTFIKTLLYRWCLQITEFKHFTTVRKMVITQKYCVHRVKRAHFSTADRELVTGPFFIVFMIITDVNVSRSSLTS